MRTYKELRVTSVSTRQAHDGLPTPDLMRKKKEFFRRNGSMQSGYSVKRGLYNSKRTIFLYLNLIHGMV